MKHLLFLITICLIYLSCTKAKNDPLWECNSPQLLDSAVISNKIIGSWLWTKQLCGDGAGRILIANKNIKITLNANATFTVLENSSIITQGNWKLKIVDSNAWGLDLNTSSEYLYGRILFCNNQVMFNDSYRDGCDNLFVKQ